MPNAATIRSTNSSSIAPAEEHVGRLEPAGELEGEDPAEAAHLTGRQRMLRVGRQARIVDAGHGRMAAERLRQRLAVGVVPGHPQGQGTQAAQQQPRVERAEHGAGEQGGIPDPVQDRRRPGQHPGRHVGVAVEVLGRAVPDQVDAEVRRPLVDRRGEGVVGEGQHVVRAGQLRDGAQVGDLQQRIARRLHQDQAGLRRQRRLERLRVGLVDQAGRHAQPWQQVQQHRRRAPVGGSLPDHVISGRYQGQHGGGGERGHPGRGDHRRG
jgi:hypothetical protein